MQVSIIDSGQGSVKQIIQSYRDVELKIATVPVSALERGHVLVQTYISAVGLGIEGKKVTTARQILIGKARSRPDMGAGVDEFHVGYRVACGGETEACAQVMAVLASFCVSV